MSRYRAALVIATAIGLSVSAPVSAQVGGQTTASETWSIDRVRSASSAELAEWASVEAPSDLLDHLIIWGGSMYVPGLLFRSTPVDVGGVCRMKTQFVPAAPEGYFAFAGALHNPDQVRLRAPHPERIGYMEPVAGESCGAWHPWDSGFAAASDEDAVRALTVFHDARRDALADENELECVAVREPCRGLMGRLTAQMIANVHLCPLPRACGTFDIAPTGARASERWQVRVLSGDAGVRVRIERGRPPAVV